MSNGPPPRRPPSGDRDEAAGRYSLTSSGPPRKRRPSSNPPAAEADAAPPTDPEGPTQHGGWQAPPPQAPRPVQLPQPAPRVPRETMRGYAIRPDADSTMQIGSFGGTPTPVPGGETGVIAQANQASYPGPIATPAPSPTPFPRPPQQPQRPQPPPASSAPSSEDDAPTTFYKRDPSGALTVSGAPPAAPAPEPTVEKPPDTARKVSTTPPHPTAAAQPPVTRQTTHIISSHPPPPAPAAPPDPRKSGAPIATWGGDFNPADDVEWQKLWLAMQRRSWRSLAVIPAGKEVQTLRVAEALAVLAWHHLGKTIKVFDATQLSLSELESRLSDMSARVGRGESVIVAFGPIVDSPTSLTLARATDAALMCIVLGESRIKSAQAAIAEIGEARFLGSVILDHEGKLK
jgi:hypothetical protein